MIWLIGGTSEAGILAKRFEKNGNAYIMSIATEDGKEFFQDCKLKIGRMTKEEMLEFCKTEKITTIADLSHPYALVVSQLAYETSNELNIKYFRFLRSEITENKNTLHFKNIEEVCTFLKILKTECVFFTTGSKNIPDFEKVRLNRRFVYRILPTAESIEKCKNAGVAAKDIIAIVGPVSEKLNTAMFREYGAEYVVLKNSGEEGGTKEKLEACSKLNIVPIMIDREEQNGIDSLDEIEKEILKNEYTAN
ncbi:precorrin-6A reductase [Treponema pedis]|uniref:Precorrin-6X reductase n=1 Tax=Treponema pedis str. T A4 TaxID=1291379 RepID=S5ZZG7_9SPIR|nr:precorrin-6A reductase [Treponema pedis]AGT43658.1 precorrin-6X reductase [Treponema pedis str. T A4]QSI04435.1 precorrin-6A reductase [Treponema pedis]